MKVVFWVWFWGDETGLYVLDPSITFVDFDEMKRYSAGHSAHTAHTVNGYWSSYEKIERTI